MLIYLLLAVMAVYVGMPSAFWLVYGICATFNLCISIGKAYNESKEKENKK